MERLTNTEERICAEVMQQIEKKRIATARLVTASYGGLLIFGIAALVPAFRYAAATAAQTGFSDYISLITTDGSRLIGSFGSLTMSLAESAPIMGGVIILALLLACVYAAKKLSTALPLVTAGMHAPVRI